MASSPSTIDVEANSETLGAAEGPGAQPVARGSVAEPPSVAVHGGRGDDEDESYYDGADGEEEGEAEEEEEYVEEEHRPRTRVRMFRGKPCHFVVRGDEPEDETDSEDDSDDDDSDDDDEEYEAPPAGLSFAYMLHLSYQALAVIDYVGDKLAYFLGITSPKYLYALREAERLREMEEEEGIELENSHARAMASVEEGAEHTESPAAMDAMHA